jgi:hypothetical protein
MRHKPVKLWVPYGLQNRAPHLQCVRPCATTYDRVVGYYKINGVDFAKAMMDKTSCKLWEKYDIWNRY